jgi:sulfate transport system ATP-binding protein
MTLSVRHVTKQFGGFVALNDVSLEVRPGELLALLGPSGSGKTTLLRILAGLETADRGEVFYQGDEVTGRPARERKMGFVFQHYALFRHMSVFENIAFALRVRGRPHDEVSERVRELVHLIRLDGLDDRYPSQLSGGQRQRVALARALAARPEVLLLDEPFGALDAKVRVELRQWLRRLHDELHVTSIFVTHDQEEAFAVSDRVVILRNGCIEQEGAPAEVFERPANSFVIDFLGNVNVFHGSVEQGVASLGALQVAWPAYPHREPRAATGYVRPHEIEIERHVPLGPSLQARVVHVNAIGPLARIQLEALEGNSPVNVEVSTTRLAELNLCAGETVHVAPRKVHVFVPDFAI